MAIQKVSSFLLYGLSSDTKPTTYATNTLFYETDTGSIYKWTGSVWLQMSGANLSETLTNKTINYASNTLTGVPGLSASNTFTGFNYYNITAAGGFENITKWSVGSSADYLSITNNVSATGSFASLIQANQTSTNADRFTPGLYFQNIAKSATDLADGESNIIFAATITGGTALTLRPLFSFRNGLSTDVLQIFPAYSDFKTNSIKNATVKANENTLSGVAQDSTVKRTGVALPQSTNLATAVGIVVLNGILTGHTATGAGTNANIWDTTEGLLMNWLSTTTAGANIGLVSPTAGLGIARRAFATRARIRSKVDAVASAVSRLYIGFTSVAAPVVSDSPVANTTEAVLVGYGSADTNWQVWTHAGSGTPTKTQFTGPIAKDTGFHTVEISWTAAGNPVVTIDSTSQTFSTDIPATTTNLFFNAVAQNVTAAIRTHSVKGIWLEASG